MVILERRSHTQNPSGPNIHKELFQNLLLTQDHDHLETKAANPDPYLLTSWWKFSVHPPSPPPPTPILSASEQINHTCFFLNLNIFILPVLMDRVWTWICHVLQNVSSEAHHTVLHSSGLLIVLCGMVWYRTLKVNDNKWNKSSNSSQRASTQDGTFTVHRMVPFSGNLLLYVTSFTPALFTQ